jgi:hypothetical protein
VEKVAIRSSRIVSSRLGRINNIRIPEVKKSIDLEMEKVMIVTGGSRGIGAVTEDE